MKSLKKTSNFSPGRQVSSERCEENASNDFSKRLRTPNSKLRTLNSELSATFLLDEALAGAQSSSLKKILFEGEKVHEIASYVAGWMAAQGVEVVVLDGANRFDPYTVSFLARKLLIPPEALLRKIRMARAFTCYQMSALMGEKLAVFLKTEATDKTFKPGVILLGPLTTFLDEDVSEREVSSLLERSLKKVDALAAEGVSFFLFQSLVSPRSKRAYLMKKLLQFSHLAWKIWLDDEGPKVTMEKGPTEFQIAGHRLQIDNFQVSNNKPQVNPKCQCQITQT